MREKYRSIKFKSKTLAMLAKLDAIISEYMLQGYTLTLRQLYYQCVARAIIENNVNSYRSIGRTVNDGRMAGVLDWDGIEDRTREFIRRRGWTSGGEYLEAAARGYHEDMWQDQEARPFVVVEKNALVGVLGPVCRRLDVPLLAAVGYPSPGVLREFAVVDVVPAIEAGQRPVVLHLGDHDGSGLDMTRDLQERIDVFAYQGIELHRIALTMEQVEELSPPPNELNDDDPRAEWYKNQYGDKSWELDAIPPVDLVRLIEDHVEPLIDWDIWNARQASIEATKAKLRRVAARWK